MAAARLLENIGEASKHLTDEILESLPGIEWKKIAGSSHGLDFSGRTHQSDVLVPATTSSPSEPITAP